MVQFSRAAPPIVKLKMSHQFIVRLHLALLIRRRAEQLVRNRVSANRPTGAGNPATRGYRAPDPIFYLEKSMFTKLISGSLLTLGLAFTGYGGTQSPAGCCEQANACCTPTNACCQAGPKAGCCEQGPVCCTQSVPCCDTAACCGSACQQCCRL